MFEKPKRTKDETYKKWLRQQSCVICGSRNTEVAHMGTGGMGTKVSDYMAIPLCHLCHIESDYSYHKLGHESFEWKNNVKTDLIILQLLKDYLEEAYNDYVNPYLYGINGLIKLIEERK